MTTMKDAIKRLKLIDEACNPKEKDAENQGLDEFTKLKKQISNDVKAVRQIIKERDDLLKADKSSKKGVGSGTETAELSFKVRSHLKTIKEEIAQLDAIVKKAEKKLKGKNKPDLQEIIDSRKEIVKLCQSHLEECENLDKARFNDKMAADRVNLFSGGTTPGASPSKLNFGQFNKTGAVNPSSALGGGALGGSPTSNAPAELPDIEVAEDLALIRQRNMDIDQELDEIGAGVQVLKQIAIQMGEEVDKQNEMLDKIDTKVDKAQEHLVSVNMKMKEALDGVMKGDKFLVNCVLLCVLLALIAYIASQLVK
ncbi:hypothetical protein GGF31_004914 [Allomyces arbusculus]|nr:hypothetical protein GGF31_004914 [Allomyces arbusculus]